MDNQNLTKELYRAICNSETNKVQEIIEKEPYVIDMKTPIGSWLHVAVRHGNINIVKYLVESGLDINASGGTSGSKPINFAASEGHLELVQYFLDNNAFLDVSGPEKNPLFSAIHKGNLEIAKLLVEKGINVSIGYDSHDAISFAKECGNKEMVEFLKGILENE